MSIFAQCLADEISETSLIYEKFFLIGEFFPEAITKIPNGAKIENLERFWSEIEKKPLTPTDNFRLLFRKIEKLKSFSRGLKIPVDLKRRFEKEENILEFISRLDSNLFGESFCEMEVFRHQLKNDDINENLILRWRYQMTGSEWFDVIDAICRITNKELKERFVILSIKENCVHLGELKGFLDEIGMINRSFDEDKKIKEIISKGLAEAMAEANLDLKGTIQKFKW